MNSEINYVSPFKKFCITIGNLPTSYLESMSYYESLTYLVNYLANNVIPALNHNGEVVEELQAKFVELKNYVDNYFDNLDVQEEINNKLDEMADGGELTDIIAQYLGLAGILTYNTVADMKAAENLANGSICETLGYNSINDGGSSLYKVVNEALTPDEATIIALQNGLYATLIIKNNEVTPEQFGCVGDGETDDYTNFLKAINYVKNTNLTLRLLNTYFIDNSIILNNDDTLILKGNNLPKENTYEKGEIIVDSHDLFVGANIDTGLTDVSLNFDGVSIKGKAGSTCTVFKALELRGCIFNECKFKRIFGLLEGGVNFVTQFINCQTINVRNFLLSDYIFNTPTLLKDVRNETYTITDITKTYHGTNADSNNLFQSCYLNGYNPSTAHASYDLPCFHLLYANDTEVCVNDCFIDFWYALEESFRTAGVTHAMSWKNCVFQASCYFFAFHYPSNQNYGYPTIREFEFIGNELTTFGQYNTRISDVADFTGANLTNKEIMFRNAIIKNNILRKDENLFIVNISQENMSVITEGNYVNDKLKSPVTFTGSQWYRKDFIINSKIDELNYKRIEVTSVPSTINGRSGTVNGWDLYFLGRKFVFYNTNDSTTVIKTLVESGTDDTYLLI